MILPLNLFVFSKTSDRIQPTHFPRISGKRQGKAYTEADKYENLPGKGKKKNMRYYPIFAKWCCLDWWRSNYYCKMENKEQKPFKYIFGIVEGCLVFGFYGLHPMLYLFPWGTSLRTLRPPPSGILGPWDNVNGRERNQRGGNIFDPNPSLTPTILPKRRGETHWTLQIDKTHEIKSSEQSHNLNFMPASVIKYIETPQLCEKYAIVCESAKLCPNMWYYAILRNNAIISDILQILFFQPPPPPRWHTSNSHYSNLKEGIGPNQMSGKAFTICYSFLNTPSISRHSAENKIDPRIWEGKHRYISPKILQENEFLRLTKNHRHFR